MSYSAAYGSTSNLTISGNTIYQCNLGIQLSASAGYTLAGVQISGNNIYDGYNWSDTNNNNHHDGIHLFATGAGSSFSGEQIYNNYIHGTWGNGMNAWIFLEGYHTSPEIFNNITSADGPVCSTCAGNGLMSVDGTNPLIVNNTLNGGLVKPSAILWTGASAVIENNVVENTYNGLYQKGSATVGTIDYNTYYQIGNGGWGNDVGKSFASWKSACSCDSHSTNGTNPNLSSTYAPTASSSTVIEQGANLTILNIASLDSDHAGILRPTTGTCSTLGAPSCWNLGAYAYLPAPTNLSVSVQ
jgi:parallel beta-helix repeat protein